MASILGLIIVALLILFNAFFVAAEFALVRVRKTRIEELVRAGNKQARKVNESLAHVDTIISATQLGITLASLALGWVGEPVVAHLFEPVISLISPKEIADLSSHTIAAILSFTIITFLQVVIGELVPKSIALQNSEDTSLTIISPLRVFAKIFGPFIWLLNSSGNAILKLMHIPIASEASRVHSEEEIKMILAQSAEKGAIEKKEAELVNRILRFTDTPIRQLMIPRTEIIAFPSTAQLQTVVQQADNSNLSRFPIYNKSIDTIIGFIHIKDMYRLLLNDEGTRKVSSKELLRPIITVPEMKKATDVLSDMRKKQTHMAVVNDEYGGTAGIVTFEDLIESIHGEIHDEFEKPQQDIQRQKDGTFRIKGLTSITRLQRTFRLPLKGQGYTTVGGLVFGILGREPQVGDMVQIGGLKFTVEALDGRRIHTLKLQK